MLDARAKGFDWGMPPPRVGHRGLTWSLGLYSVFASKEALQTYAVSDAHVKVVTEAVRPNTEGALYWPIQMALMRRRCHGIRF